MEDVSFDLAAGEIFALLGPNGAGKTTTLRMLAGLIAPSSGRVCISGETLSRENASRLRGRIGLLTEAPGLWERLSVRRNLLVYAKLHGLPHPDEAVDEALALFDLGDRAADPAAQLSKGLRQRLALARALLHRPDIVLLDEPTAGLDPGSAREVRELVRRLRSERRTVVLSTHNLDEADRVADRVAVMHTRLVAVDTPAALRARVFGSRVRIALAQAASTYAGPLAAAGFRDVRADAHTLSIGVTDPAAAAPAVALTLACFALYLGGVVLFAQPGVFRALLTPPSLAVVFILGPLAALAALQLAVCASSRASDARGAQQIGAIIVLPIAALLVAQLTGSFRLTGPAIASTALALALANGALLWLGVALFDRESILTRS